MIAVGQSDAKHEQAIVNNLQPERLTANSIHIRKRNKYIIAEIFSSVLFPCFQNFFAKPRLYIFMKSEKMEDT